MGVLLVGLMSIGALLPAGRYEILQGVKADYATTVGRSAFRDLKARGYLDPRNWRNSTGAGGVASTTVAIDPLGLTAPVSFTPTFPHACAGPVFLTRIHPSASTFAATNALADPIFRCSDDSTTTPDAAGRDRPPMQQMFRDASLAPLRRMSEGNYSWMATIVPDPTNPGLNSKRIVSVAVMYKRNLATAGAGEASVPVIMPMLGGGIGGGEVTLNLSTALLQFPKGLRPGQWIMLAGSLPNPLFPPVPPPTLNYFRWYRVAAAGPIDASTGPTLQNVTLAGTDWNPLTTSTTAFLFDNVIAVYEKNMQLEIE